MLFSFGAVCQNLKLMQKSGLVISDSSIYFTPKWDKELAAVFVNAIPYQNSTPQTWKIKPCTS